MKKLKCLNCNRIFTITGRIYSSLCSKKCSSTYYNRKKHKRNIAFKDQIVIPISGYNKENEYFIVIDLDRDKTDHRLVEKKFTTIVITEDSDLKAIYRLEYEFDKSKSIKLVPEYKKYFWATENGLIVSRRTKSLIKSNLNKRGYYAFCTKFNGRAGQYKSLRVHRLVAAAFHKNPENKSDVNHKDGIKINNFATNLEWATTKENTIHAHSAGLCTYKYGQYVIGATLTNQQANAIRIFFSNNKGEIPIREFAKLMDMGYSVVREIVAGISYKI